MITPDNIFKIEICGYETTYSFYLLGSEKCSQQRFKDLCALLFPQAAQLALTKSQQEEYPSYVGITVLKTESYLTLVSR